MRLKEILKENRDVGRGISTLVALHLTWSQDLDSVGRASRSKWSRTACRRRHLLRNEQQENKQTDTQIKQVSSQLANQLTGYLNKQVTALERGNGGTGGGAQLIPRL